MQLLSRLLQDRHWLSYQVDECSIFGSCDMMRFGNLLPFLLLQIQRSERVWKHCNIPQQGPGQSQLIEHFHLL